MGAMVREARAGVVYVVLLAAAHGLMAGPLFAAATAKGSCTGPEYRQFDFWVGDWDVFDVDRPTVNVAESRVSRILGGCVLLEDYEGEDGEKGQSFTIYDASRGVWHQTWVTDRGQLLVIEGAFESGEMVLSGAERWTGRRRLVRGTWKAVQGGVRETAVRSVDNGKTWEPWFDLMFRPMAMVKSGAKAPSTETQEEMTGRMRTVRGGTDRLVPGRQIR